MDPGMKKIVPLISSTVVGPLGVAHLPRTWLKAILAEVDALYEGWNPGYRGFNKMVLDALGVDQEAFYAFIKTMPSYPQTECWIEEAAANLNPASIAQSNETVFSHPRAEDAAAAFRERVGLSDSNLNLSANLNDLDDWCTIHQWLIEHRGEHLDPIVPTISSSSVGPLCAVHLPRLWIKALLNGVGALPPGYNSGCGFDEKTAQGLGFDIAAAIEYIHAELPSYLAFERWVREHGSFDDAAIGEYNLSSLAFRKPEEKAAAERAEAGVPAMDFREAILINDLLDWKYLHDEAVARRSGALM
jgi:hypothetical protein